MDHIRRILNKCNNISTVELEQPVNYWFASDSEMPTLPTVHCSGRICASEFGLRSHLRSHVSRQHQQHS